MTSIKLMNYVKINLKMVISPEHRTCLNTKNGELK